MKINHFEEFLCLAETLSFTRTARRFYTSKSVISRHVAALENEFGVRLLERSTHGVSITPQGKVFCSEARALVENYRRLQRNTRAVAEKSGRLVRVGYLRNAARPFIVRFSRFVKERDQEVALTFADMSYENLRHALDEKRIDVAFTMDVGQRFCKGYLSEVIYRDQFYVVVSSEHPFAQMQDGIPCARLAGEDLLLSDSFACPDLRGFLYHALGSTASAVSFDYCSDIDTMCLRVQMDEGIALQCGYNIPLASDGLLALPLLDSDSSFSLTALYRDDLDDDSADVCLDGFLHCRASMEAQRDQQQVGFALPLLT